MKHFYKITFFCCAATLWMLVLASCEGGELYDVNAPEKVVDVDVLPLMQDKF